MIEGMHVDTRVDPRGMTYHWLNFLRGDRQQGPESDYSALRAGKIVVTPLRYDRTDEDAYQALAEKLPTVRRAVNPCAREKRSAKPSPG